MLQWWIVGDCGLSWLQKHSQKITAAYVKTFDEYLSEGGVIYAKVGYQNDVAVTSAIEETLRWNSVAG